jgi:hypothetical protein
MLRFLAMTALLCVIARRYDEAISNINSKSFFLVLEPDGLILLFTKSENKVFTISLCSIPVDEKDAKILSK